jgi:hypothetical protein
MRQDDRTYVAFEFNGRFDILSEMRVDSIEWEGEDFSGPAQPPGHSGLLLLRAPQDCIFIRR